MSLALITAPASSCQVSGDLKLKANFHCLRSVKFCVIRLSISTLGRSLYRVIREEWDKGSDDTALSVTETAPEFSTVVIPVLDRPPRSFAFSLPIHSLLLLFLSNR